MRSEDKLPEVIVKPLQDKNQMIHRNRAAIQKLRARLLREQVPERIVKLTQQIAAKFEYIKRLET